MHKTNRGWSVSLILVVVSIGCGAPSQEARAPESTGTSDEEAATQTDGPEATTQEDAAQTSPSSSEGVPATPAPGSPVEEIMAVHFKDAELIRKAVIAGRPQDSGPPAESLLHLFDVSELPAAWVMPAKRMQESAMRVKDSSDISGVAAAIADIGTSCGWCHQKLGGPSLTAGAPPETDGSIGGRMKLHAWAAERLWEGLYVPSGSAWTAGANVLAETSFPTDVLRKGGVYAKTAGAEFKRLAAKAAAQHSPTARAALYSELIGTCASCHIAMEN